MAWRPLILTTAALALVATLPAAPAWAPCTDTTPANDCRENAFEFASRWIDVTATNVGAGVEPEEDSGPDTQYTIWWRFTAFADSSGSFTVHDSDHQAGHAVYEELPDGTLTFLDAASGWSSWHWTSFDCVAGRTYYVQAYGEEGQFGNIHLNGSACQIGPEPPSAPTLSLASSLGEIGLSWSPGAEHGATLTGWTVQRAADGCSAFATIATLDPTATRHADADVSDGVSYCYQVRAESTAGPSRWSSSRAAYPLGPPSAPRALAATPDDGAISLSWLTPFSNGGAAIASYRVYGADAAAGPFSLVTETTSRSATQTGLADGVTRHYRVVAVNEHGEGAAATASARTWTTPSAPRDVTIDPGLFGLTVRWNAPQDDGGTAVSSYAIFRAQPGGTLAQIATVAGGERAYVDGAPLLHGYDYAVRATNAMGDGPLSARVCGESSLPALLQPC